MGNGSTRKLVIIAISTALLTATKLALAVLPNIEVVTLLILVYASNMRFREIVLTTSVFCVIEILIFGFNTWIISYLIYWNLLGIVAFFVSKIKKYRGILMVITAGVMTTLFGIISTLVDTGLFTGNFGKFWDRFAIMYLRGGFFFLTHIVSNILIVAGLYYTVDKLYRRCYNANSGGNAISKQ